LSSVVIGWLSGCERILNLFRQGKDSYKDFATDVYNVSYDEVTKTQRKFCKPPVLGCGFGLGAHGLAAYAEGFNVYFEDQFAPVHLPYVVRTEEDGEEPLRAESLDEERKRLAVAQYFVNTYRENYAEVTAWWKQLRRGFIIATRDQSTVNAGSVTFIYDHPYLFCRLPSGRHIAYYQPEIHEAPAPWKDENGEHPLLPVMTYMGLNQKNRKWMRIQTHPGKLAENITQAVARDLLANALLNADAEGHDIVGHIHDEIITLVPYARKASERQRYVDTLIESATQLPDWANGLPLGAAGFCSRYYMKD